jgi:hypothetical protein
MRRSRLCGGQDGASPATRRVPCTTQHRSLPALDGAACRRLTEALARSGSSLFRKSTQPRKMTCVPVS